MANKQFTGTGTALITPFKRDGSIDEEALRRLVDFQEENGVDMLLACGSTGEPATLNATEHQKVMEIVIDQAKKAKVICGAGSNCTREAIDLSKAAFDLGADAILSICPYYNKPTQEGIFRHYEAIAQAVDMPMIFYNVPSRTGVGIAAETMVRLSKIPNVVAVKEASGDLTLASKVIQETADDFIVLSGNDDITVDIMELGGDGVISVASNCVPKLVSEMVNTAKAGNYAKAHEMSVALNDLFTGMFVESNPIPIKYVMSRLGYGEDVLRLPLTPISDAAKAKLDPILERMGL
ncbi:MAG: 4-hydroxy-tetrahydrodipicolinate synthase [Thermoplasmata archaeon]|nr:4-hydroxy-tetrahydrodipicolinate synthase [Thermoplasmata archaeon]